MVGGVGFGATFSGALRGLAPLTEVHERAGLFAAIFAVSHLAFGLPAIVAGQLVEPLGVLGVAGAFGAVVVVAAAIGAGRSGLALRHR